MLFRFLSEEFVVVVEVCEGPQVILDSKGREASSKLTRRSAVNAVALLELFPQSLKVIGRDALELHELEQACRQEHFVATM